MFFAPAAANAVIPDDRQISGRLNDFHTMFIHEFHSQAAALAAVTDSEETVQHRRFEPDRMDMSPLVFLF